MWFIVFVVFVVADLALLFATIDDWGRDLTTNVAETDSAHREFLLRPLSSEAELEEVAVAIRATVERLRGWQLASEGSRPGSMTFRCVRTTRLLRFKDDIVVTVEDQGETRVVSAVSRSRVGVGDLGQNPRNIKELFAALRELPPFAGEPSG